MSDPVTFEVPGEPASKQRARTVVHKGRVMSYTPKETVLAEKKIAALYRVARGHNAPAPTATFGLRVTFWFATQRRRDIDNALKLILDALNKVAFDADSQVTEVGANLVRGVGARSAHTLVEVYETDWRAAGFVAPAGTHGLQLQL